VVLTHGPPDQRIVQPLILPSPMEVLRAFIPLHTEQGLVRSIIASWAQGNAVLPWRPSSRFRLVFIWRRSLPSPPFFRPLALAGAYVPIVVFIPLSMNLVRYRRGPENWFLFIGCFVALLAAGNQGHCRCADAFPMLL